jgi:hypothetical protein
MLVFISLFVYVGLCGGPGSLLAILAMGTDSKILNDPYMTM